MPKCDPLLLKRGEESVCHPGIAFEMANKPAF